MFPEGSPTAVRHGRTCSVPNSGLPAATLLCIAGGQHGKSRRAAKPPAAVWQRLGSSCTDVPINAKVMLYTALGGGRLVTISVLFAG